MKSIKLHIFKNLNAYSKLFLVVGFFCAIASSLSTPNKLWEGCYYHLFEISFFFYLLAFYLKTLRKLIEYNTIWKTITLIILLCSLSTLIDELFYSAKLVEWNDLIRFIFILGFVWVKNYGRQLWKEWKQ